MTKTKVEEVKRFSLEEIADTPIAITVFASSIEGDRVTYSVRGNDRAVLAFGTAQQIVDYTVGRSVHLTADSIPEQLRGDYRRNVGQNQKEPVERITAEMKKDDRGTGYTLQVNGEKIDPNSVLNSYFREITFVTVTSIVCKPKEKATEKDKQYELDLQALRGDLTAKSNDLVVLVGENGVPYCKNSKQLAENDRPYNHDGKAITLNLLESGQFAFYKSERSMSKPTKDLTGNDQLIKREGKPIVAMGGVELVVSSIIVPGRYSGNNSY